MHARHPLIYKQTSKQRERETSTGAGDTSLHARALCVLFWSQPSVPPARVLIFYPVNYYPCVYRALYRNGYTDCRRLFNLEPVACTFVAFWWRSEQCRLSGCSRDPLRTPPLRPHWNARIHWRLIGANRSKISRWLYTDTAGWLQDETFSSTAPVMITSSKNQHNMCVKNLTP